MEHSDNFSGWSEAASIDINRTIGRLFPSDKSGMPSLSVSISLPSPEQAKKAYETNNTLSGEIRVVWQEMEDRPLILNLPLPFHWVFILRDKRGQRALRYVWTPYLSEAPGFRLVRKYNSAGEGSYLWKLGFMYGDYIRFQCLPCKIMRPDKLLPSKTLLLAPLSSYPEDIQKLLQGVHPFFKAIMGYSVEKKEIKITKREELIQNIHNTASELMENSSSKISDDDDISHKILITFPVWLRGRLCTRILEDAIAVGVESPASGDMVSILSGAKQPSKDLQELIWETLVKNSDTIGHTIFPRKNLIKQGKLSYIDPRNPVDMASLMTSLHRLNAKPEVVERLPPIYRQMHPSFKGALCPVQTPESEKVGINLYLSRHTAETMDCSGLLRKDGRSPDDELGLSAGLVPFYHHNDSPRNMMASKNLRQALPLLHREGPMVTTGGEERVKNYVKPLVDAGICPDATDSNGNLALGKDLLVAYLPWEGMNFEDAIVVGSQVVEDGLLDAALEEYVREDIRPGWAPGGYTSTPLFPFDGLATPGTVLYKGNLIASFVCEGDAQRASREIRYAGQFPSTLRSIEFKRKAPWTGGVLEYTLSKFLPLGLGDKLMGRHGNKGVIGGIVHRDQMPKIPKGKNIPENLRGRPVDILLNPHGVISRMNLGQLIETHLGWLLHCGVKTDEILLPGYKGKERHIGRAFFQGVDHQHARQLLKSTGLDEFGRIKLMLPVGKETMSPVVVGFQHIVRLKHVPALKIQARHGGIGASYNAATGEAVHGREKGGGQRVGEMEVWALAAHEAHAIIEEMIGIKSDVAMVNAAYTGKEFDNKAPFLRRLEDILFSLLINLDWKDGSIRFSFLEPGRVLNKVGRDRRIGSSDTFETKLSAVFCCSQGGRKPCSFRLLEGKKIPVMQTKRYGGKNLTIRFEDMLQSLGYLRLGAIENKNGEFIQKLIRIDDEKEDGVLKISFENTNDQVKASVEPDDKSRPKQWPKKLDKIYLYGRFAKGKSGNFQADEVVAQMQKPKGRFNLGSLQVTCPDHRTSLLQGEAPFDEIKSFYKGGMYDPRIFGSINSAGIEERPRWGFIELPVEIPYPVSAFLSKKETAKTSSPITIKYIPVLPLQYRLPRKEKNGYKEGELVRKYYMPIIELCQNYEKAQSDVKKEHTLDELKEKVDELFSMVAKMLNGKEGLIRKHGLGRRVDRSARLVITPDPALMWDEAGVPVPVLAELLQDRMIDWLKQEGRYLRDADNLLKAVGIMKGATDNKVVDADSELGLLENWSWKTGGMDGKIIEIFYDLIKEFLNAHKDLLIILNRQPSLHKYNMQSFYPVPLEPGTGSVLRLSPLVCKGFGADFDGDEMTIHIPLTDEAVKEAKRLLPSRNMLSFANGGPVADFDQDFVLGTYWLGHNKSGMRKEFLKILPEKCCRELVPESGMVKSAGTELLMHLIKNHTAKAPKSIHSWMNLAFKCCTHMGISFGYYELLDLCEKMKTERDKINRSKIGIGDINEKYQELGNSYLSQIITSSDFDMPGLHFAAMALSGARGKEQIRQLVAARGFLDPGGDIPFKVDARRREKLFVLPVSLSEGMNAEQAFYAAMNGRSSMCDKKLVTPTAGYLTRRLVFALWPFFITKKKDCGNKVADRTPLTCKSKGGVCRTCYGVLPDGTSPATNFPAGLIAAQSIGERGTQLSMQSFHSGSKGINIRDVEKMLNPHNYPNYFDNLEGASKLIKDFKDTKAYKDLHEKHLQLLWRAISLTSEKTLNSAATQSGLLSRMAFKSQKKTIFKAAVKGHSDPISDPIAKILTNRRS